MTKTKNRAMDAEDAMLLKGCDYLIQLVEGRLGAPIASILPPNTAFEAASPIEKLVRLASLLGVYEATQQAPEIWQNYKIAAMTFPKMITFFATVDLENTRENLPAIALDGIVFSLWFEKYGEFLSQAMQHGRAAQDGSIDIESATPSEIQGGF